MIWVQGKVVPDESLTISVLDRTLEHGLGLFETFRTWNGCAALLSRHLERLQASARELGLPLSADDLPDEQAVSQLLAANGHSLDARFRLTLSGGLSSQHGSRLWMRSFALAEKATEEGVVLGPVYPARSNRLASHKTLNYWQNRLMFEDAQANGFGECVTISADGQVWEGSRSNLFAVVDGEIVTPPCEGRLLPGIMRAVILERAPGLGLPVREGALGLLDPLFRPDEIFLTNAVRGVTPVRQWGDAQFPAPGPITRRLWEGVRSWLESGGRSS